MSTVYIPKKLKVGFQKRDDTYTGHLAYVIYYDEKNNLRKETSWENWRDKSIDSIELNNLPKSGFVIGKDIQRYGGYSWNSGKSMIRIWHPDDFEFEITPANLIMLMMHTDITKREIIGNCVLAWEGKDLILLPENSQEYRNAQTLTETIESLTKTKSIHVKNAIPGKAYSNQRLTTQGYYIGTIKKGVYERNTSEENTLNFVSVEDPLFIENTADTTYREGYSDVYLPKKLYPYDLPDLHPDLVESILKEEQSKFFKTPIQNLEVVPYHEQDRVFSTEILKQIEENKLRVSVIDQFIHDDDPDFQKLIIKGHYDRHQRHHCFYKIIGSFIIQLKIDKTYNPYYHGETGLTVIKFSKDCGLIKTITPFKAQESFFRSMAQQYIGFGVTRSGLQKILNKNIYSVFPELEKELEDLFGGKKTKLRSGNQNNKSIIDYKNYRTENSKNRELYTLKKEFYEDLNALGYGNLEVTEQNGVSEKISKNDNLRKRIEALFYYSNTILNEYYRSSW